MTERVYSIAHEAVAEINRVIGQNPEAINLLGGDDVLKETIDSIFALDNAFENRGEFLFRAGENAFETAEEFTRLHIKDYRENGRPSFVTMAMEFAEEIGLDSESDEYKAMILVALRAEVANEASPQYHSKNHYADVMALTGKLVQKNNELADMGAPNAVSLSMQQQAIPFIAAIGHDIDHMGKANPLDDPLYNEMISFEKMKPFLGEADIDEKCIRQIELILMITSPNGPHAIIKEVARANRDGDMVDWNFVDPDNKFPQLRIFEQDSQLTQMAAILSDSDLYASSGAGIESSNITSDLLTKEVRASGVNMDFRSEKARMGFFDLIVGKQGFASIAGRYVANDMYMAMRAQTAENIAAKKLNNSKRTDLDNNFSIAGERDPSKRAGNVYVDASGLSVSSGTETTFEIEEPEKKPSLDL